MHETLLRLLSSGEPGDQILPLTVGFGNRLTARLRAGLGQAFTPQPPVIGLDADL